jgi:hypothetical protein
VLSGRSSRVLDKMRSVPVGTLLRFVRVDWLEVELRGQLDQAGAGIEEVFSEI